MSGTNPHRDLLAGEMLKELREERGLSREELPREMLRARIGRDYIPSVKTIYNVEARGQIPRVRLKFGLAQFYGRGVGEIWGSRQRAAA